jgi:ClpP class serine protease
MVNWPGGAPVPSSLIGHRIRALADEKQVPVIAVAEDAAASGGSWIACVADEIVADPGSMIGSIGVVSAGFGDAIGRVGVERRIRAAGAEKSIFDPFRDETPAERERLDEMLAALHAEFIGWLRARRGLAEGAGRAAWERAVASRRAGPCWHARLAQIPHKASVHRGPESAKVLLRESLTAMQERSPMPTGW